jgi:hypothetical protein
MFSFFARVLFLWYNQNLPQPDNETAAKRIKSETDFFKTEAVIKPNNETAKHH